MPVGQGPLLLLMQVVSRAAGAHTLCLCLQHLQHSLRRADLICQHRCSAPGSHTDGLLEAPGTAPLAAANEPGRSAASPITKHAAAGLVQRTCSSALSQRQAASASVAATASCSRSSTSRGPSTTLGICISTSRGTSAGLAASWLAALFCSGSKARVRVSLALKPP